MVGRDEVGVMVEWSAGGAGQFLSTSGVEKKGKKKSIRNVFPASSMNGDWRSSRPGPAWDGVKGISAGEGGEGLSAWSVTRGEHLA